MRSSDELIDLLNLESIEENIFRGQNYLAPWKRVFGGQVLAQALHAAYNTVPEDRYAHSLHAYFILAGDIEQPIIYDVERIRDGGSFTTRRIVAIQKGRAIFNAAVSFQLRQDGLDHQVRMPNVPPPDALVSDEESLAHLRESNPELFKRFYQERPIEFRQVEKLDPVNPKKSRPFRHVWFKAKGNLSDEVRVHQEVLASTTPCGFTDPSELMNGFCMP